MLVQAILDSIGPGGTVLAFVSWDRSPYEETLNGRMLPDHERQVWPAFDPTSAGTYRGFGVLNQFLCAVSGAVRSGHPDASMLAIGARAKEIIGEHRLGAAYGRRSPLERFVQAAGKVLLLGAPLDSVTVLHHAEAIADIPNKRRVSYEMPLLDDHGRTVWQRAEDFDSNGILDGFAVDGEMDAVETIARLYVSEGRAVTGQVGLAHCHLFDAQDLVAYGRRWLERMFGRQGHRD